jgi:hypothetical protein
MLVIAYTKRLEYFAYTYSEQIVLATLLLAITEEA